MGDATLVALAALALLAGLSAYAVFAGADFGGGVWDLVAHGPRRAEQRAAISRAMGPVWEANHVWIVFLIVVLFTAFPVAFNGLCVGLFAPLSLVLLGMILRGASFAFRAHAEDQPRAQHWFGVAFSVSSLITPFVLGASAAVIADGALAPQPNGSWSPVPIAEFLRPFPIVIGLLAVFICAYVAATFLTAETEGALREDFRRRALVAGGGFAVCSLLGLVLAWREAPELAQALLQGRGLPFVLVAGVLAAVGFVVTVRGTYAINRFVAVAFVLAVLWGWAAAQWPYIITPTMTFAQAASTRPMLVAFLIALLAGSVLLVPSLVFLFRTFGAEHPEAGHASVERE